MSSRICIEESNIGQSKGRSVPYVDEHRANNHTGKKQRFFQAELFSRFLPSPATLNLSAAEH